MNVIKKSLSSVVVLTTFLLTTSAFAMEVEINLNFNEILEEVRGLTVRQTAYQQCLEDNAPVTLNKTLGNLELVCKEWRALIVDEMKVGMPSWKAWYGVAPENEHIYQQFLNGTLIYRPDPVSNEGMIALKISDLINPLEGTFDLSQCDDTGQYLCISTGYRKGMKSENKDKLEIWLAPRFVIEKKLKSSASHIEPIMGNWKEETAPVGIFLNGGRYEDLSWYLYLTSAGYTDISSKTLFENWELSSLAPPNNPRPSLDVKYGIGRIIYKSQAIKFFMFVCEPK